MQKWIRPQSIADSTVDWELSRGMIGACVSKLRVVSWITIDWQNSQPPHAYRKWIGNGAKQRDPRFRSITRPDVNIVYAKTRVYCIYLLTCVCISIPGRGRSRARLCVSRVGSRTSRLGGRFISTLMSQLEAAGICPFSGRGPRLVPARGPGVPIKGVLP